MFVMVTFYWFHECFTLTSELRKSIRIANWTLDINNLTNVLG